MADSITFKVENIDGFKRAMRLAPKVVTASIKRELLREGTKAQTKFRKSHLFGPPGINLPRRVASTTKTGKVVFKKRKVGRAKKTQLAHVLVKVIQGRHGILLVGYLSRFLGFHASKLSAAWQATFRAILPNIKPRLEKEAARITQAVIDKNLRDTRRT